MKAKAVFPLALIVTAALAFVPSAWLGWTSALSDLVRFPLLPLSQLGRSAALWLRPSAIDRVKASEVEELRAALEKETTTSEQYRQLYDREHQEARRLQSLLADLSQLPSSGPLAWVEDSSIGVYARRRSTLRQRRPAPNAIPA